MHWMICKEFGIEVKEDDMSITEKDSVIILREMPIHTDRTIAADGQNVVLKNKKDKTCLLIDMTIPVHTNTSVETTEKLDVTNRKTWKYRLSEFGASKQQQSRWL